MRTETLRHPILILFAHPALQKSRVNRQLLNAVIDLDGVTVHDLYEIYPDFHVDVAREQALLRRHDVVVFQHPLYWFNMPALLKQWQEVVLQHKWAYGTEGAALQGKTLLTAVSTGGREVLFSREGSYRRSIREYLAPAEQLARLCGMDYLPPFVVHGTKALTAAGIARHAADYRRVMTALRDGRVDWEAVRPLPRLNAHLDSVLPD